jgi:glycosyltransferase involved in cell wall biosynthesis
VKTSPPSIAFDATLWDEPTTGIGLYTRALAAALEQQGVPLRRLGARKSGDVPRHSQGRSEFFLRTLPGLLAASPEPIFHGVSNFTLPLLRVPGKRLVLTVHDLIPLLVPDTVSTGYRWQFRLWLSRSLQIADAVICVSDRTRLDLLSRFKLSSEKLHVVHLGADHVDQVPRPNPEEQATLRSFELPERFVLYASALDARKNAGLLLEACQQLRRRGQPLTLVLAGQRWFGSGSVERTVQAMRASGLDIRMLGYQPEAILFELMRRATAFVLPSRYEGFGLPPLEAMRLGTPVLVSDAGALPEVCGDAARYFHPDHAPGLADLLSELLASPAERERLTQAGLQRAARFTWAEAARRTLEVYRLTKPTTAAPSGHPR